MVTKSSSRPLYIDMIIAAITALKNKKGSSKFAILKYIEANYNVSENASQIVKMTLVRNLKNGKLKQVTGVGAVGSFKVGEVAVKPKVIKATKSTPKKASAKRKVKPKTPVKSNKPVVKKSTSQKKTVPQKKKMPQKKKTPQKKNVSMKKKASSKKKSRERKVK